MESLDMRGSADDVSHFGNLDWQKKVFKEVDKVQPEVLTFVIHKKDNYEKHGAGNWLTEILQQQVNRGGTVIVFDAGATPRWNELNLEEISRRDSDTPIEVYYLYAGDLGIATSSQAVGEAFQSWASKENRFYCPTSTDTLGEPEFGETLEPFSTISMADL